MTKRLNKILMWLLIPGCFGLLLVGLTILFLGQNRSTSQQEAKTSVKYETRDNRLEGSTPFTIGANQQFVVAPRGVSTTQHYLVHPTSVYEVSQNKSHQKKKVKDIIVTMAIDDNFAYKEFDVSKATEEYKKDVKVYKFVDALTYNGQDLAIISLVKDIESKEIDEYVGIDLSNGQMVSLPEELQTFYNNPDRDGTYYEYYQEPFARTTLNSLLAGYNLFSRVSISYLDSDSNQSDSNASKSLNLFTEYASQSLWDRLYGEPAYAIYPRPESVTVEEWFNTSLHWFAPASGEDLTVYGIENYWGSDGHVSDYTIRSYADYQAFKTTQSGE